MIIETLELAASPAQASGKVAVARLREAGFAGAHRPALEPGRLEPVGYRWSVGIATTRGVEPAARVFIEALSRAWPGEELDLALLRFGDGPAQGRDPLAELSGWAFDLLFVLDDPGAPDEIAAFLSLARSARQTPVLLADPCAAPHRDLAALSLPVYPTALERFAWEFAQWGMLPLMTRGLVCIDWQEVLSLLDAEGGIGSLLHVEADSLDEARPRLLEAVEARLACAPPGHRVEAMQTTICAPGLRMCDVRACVQSLRTALPDSDDTFFTYAALPVQAERCQLFAMLLFLPR